MGYDYDICYKKGKENIATDALFRIHSSELLIITVYSISTNIIDEIQKTWENDPALRILISQLKQQTLAHSPYVWADNQLTRKNRLVVGDDKQLQLKIIRMFHEKSLGGHSRMQATVKTLLLIFF